VQALVWWYVDKRGKLPKKLRWQGMGLDCYRALDSDDALTMFDLEQYFDAGAGHLRIAPEYAEESSRLSDAINGSQSRNTSRLVPTWASSGCKRSRSATSDGTSRKLFWSHLPQNTRSGAHLVGKSVK
jgi:hypothetical protein